MSKLRRILYASVTLGGVLVVYGSLYVQNLYLLRVAILAVIIAILALSVDLLVGYTGQVSLGHAGFYGIGAYTLGVLNVTGHLPFWIALIISVITAGLVGLVLGLPTTKLKGHFLGIATLGFGVIVNGVLNNWTAVTGGPNGIRGIEKPSIFSISLEYDNYFLGFAVASLLLIILVISLIVHSPIGRAWKCLKQDEITANVAGINVYKYKLLAFTLSGAIAGYAGALFAGYMTFISPETFDLNQSIAIMTTVILGGTGTLLGPLVGTAILSFFNEWLRNFNELRLVIYGMIMVTMIVLLPEGIYPFLKRKIQSLFFLIRGKKKKVIKTEGKEIIND